MKKIFLPFIFLLVSLLSLSCSQKSDGGTILVLLGSKIPYWQQIASGAEQQGKALNLKMVTLYRDADTIRTSIINALNNLQQYENLKGIVLFSGGDSLVEQTIATVKPNVPIVAVDQVPADNSPIKNMIRTSVVANNNGLGKGIASKVVEKQLVTLCYPIGGSLDRSLAINDARGKDIIHKILVSDAAAAAEKLKEYIENREAGDYAVVFTTGSFINAETIKLLEGKKVYTVDMDSTIASYIRNGSIVFTAIPNTYEMGSKAVDLILGQEDKLPTQYISVLYANKNNIDSPAIQQFLK